jgi:hypothetical protein
MGDLGLDKAFVFMGCLGVAIGCSIATLVARYGPWLFAALRNWLNGF